MILDFEITRPICVISERNGWTKELNFVSWGDRDAKLDIRSWNGDHTKMDKGVTLTEEETERLYMALHNVISERSE